MYHYRVGRRRGLVGPRRASRDRTSRGRSTRRNDRRRVFACLLVAPVFLLEENSVTARLSFETPARLSLAALERLTLRAVLSTIYTGARHNAVRLRRAGVSAQAICLLDQ